MQLKKQALKILVEGIFMCLFSFNIYSQEAGIYPDSADVLGDENYSLLNKKETIRNLNEDIILLKDTVLVD